MVPFCPDSTQSADKEAKVEKDEVKDEKDDDSLELGHDEVRGGQVAAAAAADDTVLQLGDGHDVHLGHGQHPHWCILASFIFQQTWCKGVLTVTAHCVVIIRYH